MAKGVRFTTESAKRISTTVKIVEALPADLTPHRRRGHRPDEAAAFPWDKTCFGYKISGTTVTIYASEVDGNAVAQTDVTPSAGANKVYVRITKANGTALVAVAASVPANTTTYRYYRLYDFSRADDVVTLTKAARPFVIEDGLPNGGAQYQVIVLDSNVEQTWGWVTRNSIKAAGVAAGKYLKADGEGNSDWDYIKWV